MKLGTALLRLLLVLGIAAAAGQWWLVRHSQEEAKRFIARFIPYGELRYEKLWPWPWGAGRVWNLSFQPEGMARILLRTPEGFRLTARELRIHDLRFDGDGRLDSIDGTLFGVEVPVNPVHADPAKATDPADNPWPTLFDLGYTHLPLDLDFNVQYVHPANLATVKVSAAGTDSARVFVWAQLEGTPATFDRTPDQVLIRKGTIEFADAGLMARLKDVSAARSHLNREEWEQAMIEHLDRKAAAAQWKWDDASAQAVRRAIRDSGYFRAGIDPPGDVVVHNMQLYPIGNWPQLLGFTFVAQGRFDHPAPGNPLP